MSGGSPVGNALANSQQQTPMGGGASPLNTGGGMSGGQTSSPTNFGPMVNYGQGNGGGFGGQQMPNFAMPYMQQALGGGRQPQQQFAPVGSGRGGPIDPSMKRDRRMALGQMLGYDPGPQQPDSSMVAEEYPTVSHFGDMQYRPQQQQPLSFDDYYKVPQQRTQQAYRIGEKEAEYQRYRDNFGRPSGMQVAQPPPMQNPFQPQQGYNPYQQQMQQMRQFQQPSPFRGGQFQQRFAPYQSGLQSLMGQLRGRPVPQPRMTMDMPQTNQPMETLPTSFPQTFGREQRYSVPAYSADYSGMSSATRTAVAEEAAKAVQAAQAAQPPYDPYISNSGF